jgi:hypothetical protein
MKIPARLPTDSSPMLRRNARVDGRSKPAKRAKQLAASFVAQLGDAAAGAATLAAVLKAAEIVVLGEELRAKALRGEPIDLGALVRIENLGRRAVADLALDRHQAAARGPTLAEHLARRAMEQAGDRSDAA